MAHLLGAQSLHLEYPTKVIFESVTLGIDDGDRIGIVGANGAGKSTLFKMMLGLVPATQGDIRIGSVQVGGDGFRAVRRQLGYLPENVVLYDNLNGLETLHFFARLKQYRAIATRYDKTACNFLGAIHLAASVIWLN